MQGHEKECMKLFSRIIVGFIIYSVVVITEEEQLFNSDSVLKLCRSKTRLQKSTTFNTIHC